jgi:hypothetical protein
MSETEPVDPAPASGTAAEAAAPAAPARKRWTRFITPALALVAALVIGGVAGVFIGQNTGSRGPSAMGGPSGFVPRDGGPQLSGGPEGSDFTAGTIESIDGDTLTVKLEDGTTVTVTTDDDTAVSKTEDAEVGDLETGDEIAVIGEKDDDGNVDADSISEGGGPLQVGGPISRQN